ncbi:alpha/beta hydrolase [bacterium]|nr:MAG: alpha/beta hydrolase [bacterium]
MPSIAFFHGWGFDRDFWGNVNLGAGWDTYVFDRGYFGTQELYEDLPRVDLIVAHSWGLHWVPDYLFKNASGIVVLNSFLSFPPDHKLEQIKTLRILDKMMKGFEDDPHTVLEQFYLNVFAPQTVPWDLPDFVHDTLLLHDLEQMKSRVFDMRKVNPNTRWLIMQGKKDVIRAYQGEQEWDSIKKNARYKAIESAGHAIWKTHTQECIQSIRLWLKTVF